MVGTHEIHGWRDMRKPTARTHSKRTLREDRVGTPSRQGEGGVSRGLRMHGETGALSKVVVAA